MFCIGLLSCYTANIFLHIIETSVYATQYNLNSQYNFFNTCLLITLVRALLLRLCFAKANFRLRKGLVLSDIFVYNLINFLFYRYWSLITDSL
jgi:hypothetical protein